VDVCGRGVATVLKQCECLPPADSQGYPHVFSFPTKPLTCPHLSHPRLPPALLTSPSVYHTHPSHTPGGAAVRGQGILPPDPHLQRSAAGGLGRGGAAAGERLG
jgi:hypothetical protein